MDLLDEAQAYQERELERALSGRKVLLPVGMSAVDCEECGDPIPEARRVAIAGVQTCVDCQQLIESGRI